jgi:hypothetical protein
MKTDDLIALMAADTTRAPAVPARLGRAVPVAVAVALGALVLFWGFRADLAGALGSAAVLKTLVPVALALLALWLARDLARPEARPVGRAALLGLVLAALAGVFLVAMAGAESGALAMALAKPSLVTCLLSVPALSLPVLGAILWALSAGAPVAPVRSGAVAGLAAAGLGAGVYSLYCDVDMALFVLPAYGAAMLAVTAAGAVLGRFVLRW